MAPAQILPDNSTALSCHKETSMIENGRLGCKKIIKRISVDDLHAFIQAHPRSIFQASYVHSIWIKNMQSTADSYLYHCDIIVIPYISVYVVFSIVYQSRPFFVQ